MGKLYFNYGLADITPEESLLLAGFANRRDLSGAIHRRLTSRCVVLKQGRVVICLVVNDLMDLDPAIIESIKSSIAEKTGVDINAILITSIHSHSAPEMETGRNEANDRYIAFFTKTVSDNACKVVNDHTGFKEAFLYNGKADCDINIARRDVKPSDGGMAYRVGDPEGLTDKEVAIFQLADETGFKKVTIFNYACHPVILGYESNYVSTDYPGRAREIIEEAFGGMAVFLNGAAGDLNPREAHKADPAIADKEGERLGKAVISAKMTRFDGNPDLKTSARIISVPFRDRIITKRNIEREAKRKASDITEFFTWDEMLDRWKKKVFDMIDRNEIKTTFPFKINTAILGKTIIFFTQGELFVKYQIELKKRFPGFQVLCVGYVHGIGAYIPTAEAFEKKTYEADQAYIYEVMPSPLSPLIEKIYLEGAIEAINELIMK
jgi:hypothetical protein